MKKYCVLLVLLMLLGLFSGCDYYSDESISVTLPESDSNGLVEYMAGVSAEKNTARIDLLKYELDEIRDGQIHITLPETIENTSGSAFPIAAFGGPIGTSAPLQKFELMIQIQSGVTAEEAIALTIDAGSLPLDTRHWRDIQICFLAEGTVVEIPVESVIFLSDEPLIYKLHLKEEAPNGSISDAADSSKWYEIPNPECLAGEKVVIRIKHPEDGVDRSLAVTHEPVELVDVQDEYMQYEFTMPYHDVRLTIVDEKD
jgi:hypothetical protein